jgi:hypothetical protein
MSPLDLESSSESSEMRESSDITTVALTRLLHNASYFCSRGEMRKRRREKEIFVNYVHVAVYGASSSSVNVSVGHG